MTGWEQVRAATFAGTADSVREARRFVFAAVDDLSSDEVTELIVLLTSELAANAVLHARSSYTVTVYRRGPLLRVAVADASPAQPHRRRYAATSGTGRGLAMVEDACSSWGVEPSGAGKAVWFEVNATASVDDAMSTVSGGFPFVVDPENVDALLREFPSEMDDSGGAKSLAAVGS